MKMTTKVTRDYEETKCIQEFIDVFFDPGTKIQILSSMTSYYPYLFGR
jgi:hypothetical protein